MKSPLINRPQPCTTNHNVTPSSSVYMAYLPSLRPAGPQFGLFRCGIGPLRRRWPLAALRRLSDELLPDAGAGDGGLRSHGKLKRPRTAGPFLTAVRRRLRAIIIHQKKRRRFLLRHLWAKGVTSRAAAGAAYNPKGRWFRSNHAGMTQAYPPSWFRARMTSLKTRWTELNRAKASEQLAFAF